MDLETTDDDSLFSDDEEDEDDWASASEGSVGDDSE